MFCGHCGTKMEKVERFCTECGKEQLQENQGAYPYPAPYSKHHQEAYTPAASDSNNKKALGTGMIATICAAFVVLITIGLFLILRTSYVEVPDFRNLAEEEAIQLIEESRLTVGEITEEYSGRVEEGLVISQSPRAGREVERGSTIDLTISLGVEPALVPDLTELRLNEAIDLIENLGLILGDVDEEFSENVDSGLVISQSTRAGIRVEQGTSIDLVVSLGPEAITVPDFTGLTEDEAIELIESSQLRLGRVYEDYDDNLGEGLVIDQFPRVGSSADPGDSIDLVVSLGSRPPSVSPFDLDVWGEDQVVTLELDGVSVDVPIPPWLNDVLEDYRDNTNLNFDDRIRGFLNTGVQVYVIDRHSDVLKTMIEVTLFPLDNPRDFQDAAEQGRDRIESFLRGLSYNSDVMTIDFYQGEGELTAGYIISEYPEDGSEEFVSVYEIIKFNEYNGIIIRTRLRIRTVNAPEAMCSEEFSSAFGLWRYIDMGIFVLD